LPLNNFLQTANDPVEAKPHKSTIRSPKICKNPNKNAYSTPLKSPVNPLSGAFCKSFTEVEKKVFSFF
jgi:hypothetical protein